MHGRLCATRLEDRVFKVVNVVELWVMRLLCIRVCACRYGVVTAGRPEADRSFLTGESMPLVVGPGDDVIAGDVNLTGPLRINVTATGEDTTLRRMAAFGEAAVGTRIRYTALADRCRTDIRARSAFAGVCDVRGVDCSLR